ncbi:MAG: guanosine-3',5'-bis(diphosphate) 3'-pyrophosphohydrolase [Kiritimatiellia bacterium]|jgi:guanosine-3',5'-bis(diphosphate) 3'-pyrophosphohydrolase
MDTQMNDLDDSAGFLIKAIHFAAEKHLHQRRKGADRRPYINHPLEVMELLWTTGEVRDPRILAAAVLHDTVEDTETTPEELEQVFGADVRDLVMEVTDNKTLMKKERKRVQVQGAASLSHAAQLIRISDKCCNIRDIAEAPPADWSLEWQLSYLDWASHVVEALQGVHPRLEAHFRELLQGVRASLQI